MMRSPIKTKARTKGQVSRVITRQAPTKGWNARDSIANMGEGYAVRLLNWFPTANDCVVRGGQADHVTGATQAIKTLATYNGMNGANVMFGCASNGIFNVTSAGAIGAAAHTYTNGKAQYVNFGDGTSNWLILVNGTDKPAYYNGSAWTAVDGASTPALTGLTTTDIIHVCVHKGRLFFVQKNSMSVWYLAAGAAGGALTEFDFSSIFTKGGYLMWMATWTRDGGAGTDDYAVFMSSQGEIAIYQGTNPSSANTWAKVGTYFMGKPLGRKSYINFGGDLIVITENGAISLQRFLQDGATNTSAVAISNIIENEFNVVARSYSANYGWQACLYPKQNAMLFNIPVIEGGTHRQFVMNTVTKAWCEFDSWNAECFEVLDGELYYGHSTGVQKAWTGQNDDGSNVVADGKTAFDYFGSVGASKRFSLYRPMLQCNGAPAFFADLDVDFADTEFAGSPLSAGITTALWDTAVWDAALWAGNLEIYRNWVTPNAATGYCAAGRVLVHTNAIEVHWVANDYVIESGGVL